MKIAKFTWMGVVALSIAITMTGSLQARTLEEVLKIALETNPDLLLKEASRRKQDNNLRGAFGGYFPKVDLTASFGRDKNTNNTTRAETGSSLTLTKREAGISLNQMLFDGFSVQNNVEANAASLKSAAKDVVSTMENVILRSAEAYLEVLRLRTNVKFAKENLAHHQEIFQQIRLRAESGVGKRADLDQATGRLALARTNLMDQQAALRDAEATFKRITGIKADVLVRPEVSSEVLPAAEDAAVALALRHHPALQKAEADVVASRADKRKAKASYYPALNLQLTGTDNKNVSGLQAKTDSLSVMLKLSYNVFRGGADRAQENAAAWALEETKEILSQTRRQIEQSTHMSWNAYSNARAQLGYRKEHVEATQKTRDAYRDQFSIGQRTLLDLLDSENELFGAKTSYISAQYIELLGKYRVLGSMGRLIHYLKIPLPVTAIYHPCKWLDGF